MYGYVDVYCLLLIVFHQPPSPTASITTILNDETVDLIERLADVQQEKWLLEERVRIFFVDKTTELLMVSTAFFFSSFNTISNTVPSREEYF